MLVALLSNAFLVSTFLKVVINENPKDDVIRSRNMSGIA
jgi:hypothetical protein